ncbi:MAG: VWA domain-containing protein [Blastochloris sp.]|nr:VWA domain-containing protein [Blastochloris sp.]
MKINCQLDYKTILENLAQPVHLVVCLGAEKVGSIRPDPVSFCLVLDRSGSMAGKPLEYARKACELVVKNLRSEDLFSLVVFDGEAQVLIPLQKIVCKNEILATIRQINKGGSTNLTAGWMLGRDELKKAPQGVRRRLLLLGDGQLNQGIVDPVQVGRIVGTGVEQDRVRTSCLGFGDGYNEVLLKDLAKVSGGDFHDADNPEKLPVILKEELEGLQNISAQNVRLRFKSLPFCEKWGQLSDYPVVALPDGRTEVSVGDLVSEEDRVLVLMMEVLPLPLLNGKPVASLEGEALLEMEVLWDEIGEKEITSQTHEQTIRIQATQNPEDIKLNQEVVAWIAVQRAGKTVEEATEDAQADRVEDAKKKLKEAISVLQAYKLEDKTADGLKLLQQLLEHLEEWNCLSPRSTKGALYSSSYYRKGSTSKSWTAAAACKPSFSKVQSVEEQLKDYGNGDSGSATKP